MVLCKLKVKQRKYLSSVPHIICLLTLIYPYLPLPSVVVNTLVLSTALSVIKHVQGWKPHWIAKHLESYPAEVGLQRKLGIESKWQEDKEKRKDSCVYVGGYFCLTILQWGLVCYDGWPIWQFILLCSSFQCVLLRNALTNTYFYFRVQVFYLSGCCFYMYF